MNKIDYTIERQMLLENGPVATFLSTILGDYFFFKVSLNVFPKVSLKILYGNPLSKDIVSYLLLNLNFTIYPS